MARKEQHICEGLNWIDLTDPTVAEMDELSREYRLNQYTVKDGLEPEHLPKHESGNEVHFLILRFYAHEVERKVSTLQELTNKTALFFTERFLITIHKSATPVLDIIRKRHVKNINCNTTMHVLPKWRGMH